MTSETVQPVNVRVVFLVFESGMAFVRDTEEEAQELRMRRLEAGCLASLVTRVEITY